MNWRKKLEKSNSIVRMLFSEYIEEDKELKVIWSHQYNNRNLYTIALVDKDSGAIKPITTPMTIGELYNMLNNMLKLLNETKTKIVKR